MRHTIIVGTTGTATETVTRELTVAHLHPEMPEVYGTPMLVYLMEMAATKAIERYLPTGWGSVGLAVSVEHLAATPVGFTVTAKAVVTKVSDRTVEFAVEAYDDTEVIGRGVHTRALVERARFDERVKRKAGI